MPSTTNATWIDLLDPTEAELREALPAGVHEIALEAYLTHDEIAPRPRLVSDGKYLFGALVIAVVNDDKHDQDTVSFQEVDLYVSMDLLVTIRKTRGEDIDAACGQLAGQVTDRTTVRLGSKTFGLQVRA